ncbi:MAG: hypothetical protein K9M02_05120 [Thiohalocapsa sp.]|nr:hypothetical protein [Thiohalocapsa sp.]
MSLFAHTNRILLTLCAGGLLLGAPIANALITDVQVKLNGGGTTVTVGPGETVTVVVSALVANNGAPNSWRTTFWDFNGDDDCSNVPEPNVVPGDGDPIPSGDITVTNLTAPDAPGSYPIELTLYASSGCQDTAAGSAGPFSGSVTVRADGPVDTEGVPVMGLPGLALLAAAMAGLGLSGMRRRG